MEAGIADDDERGVVSIKEHGSDCTVELRVTVGMVTYTEAVSVDYKRKVAGESTEPVEGEW